MRIEWRNRIISSKQFLGLARKEKESHPVGLRTLGWLIGIAFIGAFLAACSASPQPAATPTSSPTPMPPPNLIPGRWSTVIGEKQSHDSSGVVTTVSQLRFGTIGRLFPDVPESELAEFEVQGAKAAVGLSIEVENTTSEPVTVFPGGITASVLLNTGEELYPSAPLSDVSRTIEAGNGRNFLVVFPIFQSDLADIDELTYKWKDVGLTYTDLGNLGGSSD